MSVQTGIITTNGSGTTGSARPGAEHRPEQAPT